MEFYVPKTKIFWSYGPPGPGPPPQIILWSLLYLLTNFQKSYKE